MMGIEISNMQLFLHFLDSVSHEEDSGFCNHRDNCNERFEISRAHLRPMWAVKGEEKKLFPSKAKAFRKQKRKSS